jgi:hypothetical protein
MTQASTLLSHYHMQGTEVAGIELRLFQGRLLAFVYTGASGSALWGGLGSPAVNDGLWHLVGMTRRETTVSLYVDGLLVASGDWTLSLPSLTRLQSQVSNFTFACRYVNATPAVLSQLFFSGALDDLRVYSVVWGPEQMARFGEMCVCVCVCVYVCVCMCVCVCVCVWMLGR